VSFGDPVWLAVLAGGLPLLAAAVVLLERRRRRDLDRFGDPRLLGPVSALPARRGRAGGLALAAAGLGLATLALARPQLGREPLVLTRTGRDVVFALDLSRSMNAEDAAPSRLGAAKRAVRALLEASPGDRVALVVFGGSAFLQVPLTLDRAAFELFLDAADTDDVSDPGTNLEQALRAAGSAFGPDSERRYRVAVVLSDGEELEGEGEAALEDLRQAGVRVFALGVGTPGGAPIPLRAGSRLAGWHRDAAGEVVVSRLREDGLRRVAQATGGRYEAWDGGAGAGRLAAELAGLEKREISSRALVQRAERFQWPLALAVAALLAGSLLERRAGGRGRGGSRPWRTGALLLLPALAALGAARPAAAQGRGERLYREGRFEEAYEAFREQADRDEAGPELHYNAGNALYRLGRYAEAAERYRRALEAPAALRQRASYNLGNAAYRGAEGADDRREGLRAAVRAYEESLLLSPADTAAKWNLELALRELEREEQRQAEGGGGGGGGEEGGGGGGGDPRPQGSDGPRDRGSGGAAPPQAPSGGDPAAGLGEEDARRLLEAIENEEREALESRDRGRARGATGRNDW
jgi:Ca-activated chloride channel family protein